MLTERSECRSEKGAKEEQTSNSTSLFQWNQVCYGTKPKSQRTARSYSDEQTEDDEGCQIVRKSTSDVEDEEDEVADVVDDGTTIDFAHRSNDERTEDVAKQVYGSDKRA